MGRDGERERKGAWLGGEGNPRGAFLPLSFSRTAPTLSSLKERQREKKKKKELCW